jgi:hypothetical protein
MALPTIVDAQGVTRLTLKSTLTVSVGDLLGFDGTDWVKADADARIPAEFMAMVSTVDAGLEVPVCRAGILFDSDAPYTKGATQYLSATAGAHTATIPAMSSTLTIIQRVGLALSTSEMSFDLTKRGPTYLRAQVTKDVASLNATTAATETATVTGLLAADVVRPGPHAPLTGTGWDTGLVVQNLWASNADELSIRVTNPTAGALNGASEAFDIYVERW